ncbi:hypothetical protein CU098_006031, partial [Rhizopus stolonifer]
MSFPRAMPNIKPYPHQQETHADMPYHFQQKQYQQQQQKNYSVYRPAYHRIPSTTTRQSKDAWAAMSPEASPIVVPSMSAVALQPQYLDFSSNLGYYSQPVHTRTYYPAPVMHPIPIHHTLENATISYDTVEHSFQKELVKDVFFSPAMTTDGREMSPSDLSTCTQSDNESDVASTPPHEYSPPSEFLLDDNEDLFDFGLDLATNCASSNQTITSSYEEVRMQHNKKPCFTLSKGMKFNYQTDLPTPPANTDSGSEYGFQYTGTKRRCSDSVIQDRIKNKKQRQTAYSRSQFADSTPPVSPGTLKDDALFESNEYFDDASGEESEDEQVSNRLSLEYNRFDTSASGFQTFEDEEDEDDSFSTTSWEVDEVLDSDSASEEDDEEEEEEKSFKAPTKTNHPKRTKKSIKDNSFVDDLFVNENCHLPKALPRATAYPTIYQKLTKANIDWCRYCGTTEGVNWRPGPWGKRTLCNKHGCDYKGYGFACKLPRLDLTGFTRESIDDRERPVLQLYCSGCQRKDSWEGNVLVRCEGCPKAYHQKCCQNPEELNDAFVASQEPWFCDASCSDNARRKRIVVELPRKRLPLMCAPKSSSSASSVSSEPSSS